MSEAGPYYAGDARARAAQRLAEALRICASLLEAEAASENRRYRIDGRTITVGDAIDRAAEVLGRWAALEDADGGLPPVRPVAKDGRQS